MSSLCNVNIAILRKRLVPLSRAIRRNVERLTLDVASVKCQLKVSIYGVKDALMEVIMIICLSGSKIKVNVLQDVVINVVICFNS